MQPRSTPESPLVVDHESQAVSSIGRHQEIPFPLDPVRLLADGRPTSNGFRLGTVDQQVHMQGLICNQFLHPVDHLLVQRNALPLSVITRGEEARNNPGFLMACRQCCGWIRILEGADRWSWISPRQFLLRLYHHSLPVAATDLSEWLVSSDFRLPLASRIQQLGLSDGETLIANAACEPGWQGLATLDAVVRQHAFRLRKAARRRLGFLRPWWRRTELSRDAFIRDWQNVLASPENVPARFWFARPMKNARSRDQVMIRGAVVLQPGTK